ncbi:hypothetical protein D1822_19020 (plasmid) [Phaeobacter inhibens]|uniref:Chemotaxis protein n=1 Tax=Phaeobacter inhibens TaxID=221822 RepID=A0A2I7KF53_9RHOB|nr:MULTISPECIES: hypothetical protein [Phaeobacter]AFO89604.1 hypothetical protein PGA2_239p1810 [Phaeobacter inhibens 2.10]AFO93489.1 hypothetical protein PGA1_262p02080 [Phaeobacter inhibens DSM 17395]APX17781.1 hypothetical protein BWR17_17955 [Phaeobacter inhibens]AUQ48188.1 hypothetical protein PhaeoP10_03904 [Phaeobacter inhibens]AUQ52120.1 hypothetical protein PhaeoP83_03902 [Phaeobacter inhibens]
MNMQSTPPPKGHTISDLCDVSRAEMKRLQEQVQVLEDTVLTIFERGTPPTREERQSLQDFDLVVQTLAAMVKFYDELRKLAADTGGINLEDSSAVVTLHKLRDRLRDPASAAQE